MFKLTALLLCCCASLAAAKLAVSGKNFVHNGQKVFLSGANIAWKSYGYDFGNGQYASSKATLESWLDQISANGGNTVRMWVHVEGGNTPEYDKTSGLVTAPDRSGTLINDLKSFLDHAKSKNLFVILVLWNGAVLKEQKTKNLFWDDSKLQSYIDKALKPMVKALGGHPALGAWEVLNEPEGSLKNNVGNSNPCLDTTPLATTGAGWNGNGIPIKNIQKFVNWQTHAIHETSPGSLVTVGSWSEHGQTNAYPQSRNYFSDQCLINAGGRQNGKLDFYQMHTYSHDKKWNPNAPFKVTAASYGLDKPLLIGEYAGACSQNEGVTTLVQTAYDKGYAGALSWHYNGSGDCTDSQPTQNSAMNKLKSVNGSNGVTKVVV